MTGLPEDYVPKYSDADVKGRYLHLADRCDVYLNAFDRKVEEEAPEKAVDTDDISLLVNEGFAMHMALCAIGEDLKIDKLRLDPEYHANLLYDLHYRLITDDALLHIFDTCKMLALGHSVIFESEQKS